MTLLALFENCLNARYISTENGGDYAIEKQNGIVYIYLESSDGAEDWKNNFSFSAKKYKREGKTAFYAHGGFLRVFLSILPHLESTIQSPANCRFTVVGYSHGGALAALLFEHILFRRPELEGQVLGYGFGAPRVFWGWKRKELCKVFSRFTVVRNKEDVVTHLPPSVFGFFHAGEILSVGKAGKYSAVEAHRPENILRELPR